MKKLKNSINLIKASDTVYKTSIFVHKLAHKVAKKRLKPGTDLLPYIRKFRMQIPSELYNCTIKTVSHPKKKGVKLITVQLPIEGKRGHGAYREIVIGATFTLCVSICTTGPKPDGDLRCIIVCVSCSSGRWGKCSITIYRAI